MPDPTGDPTGIQAITLLFTALGLSSASGLRAYLPLLAVAIGSDIPTGDGQHLITLSQPFQALGSGWLIALLVLLVLGEFVVDKIPVLDHISDAIHTVIRPLSGAVIMAGTSNSLSEASIWVAAFVGAVLALTVHSAKAASRPAVTATTAGIGNPIVSIGEDIMAVLVTALAVLAPIIALALIIVLAVAVALLVRAGWRKLRARRGGPMPAMAGVPAASTPPASAGPGGPTPANRNPSSSAWLNDQTNP